MFAGRNPRWNKTADVVVVGFGAAGAVAAATAAENGAETLIVEKQERQGRQTNASLSGGHFIVPTDVKTALEYMKALSRVTKGASWAGEAVIKAWAEYATTGKDWIEARAGNMFLSPAPSEHPQLPGGAVLPRYIFRGMGVGLGSFLDDIVKARDIPVLYDARATHLLEDIRGRVVGVQVQTNQTMETLRIRASRAVVLASGGFEFDEFSKLNFLKVYPSYYTGSQANTGDGLMMAMEVGAQLWHMNCGANRLVLKFPELPFAFTVDYLGKSHLGRAPGKSEKDVPVRSGHIIVDRDGKRYTSENVKSHTLYYELPMFDSHRLIYPRVPSYFIFDRKRLENGPIPIITSGASGRAQMYRWSPDNSIELERGWIKTAGTIRGLARRIGVPADSLERTVRTFNQYCSRGEDPDFGRTAQQLIALENPPYCAMELWPGGPTTMGGPRRNHKAQILNVDGMPVPGLYGCGELGCVYGMLYPGAGGHLAECFAFGRIAGENATKERARPNV